MCINLLISPTMLYFNQLSLIGSICSGHKLCTAFQELGISSLIIRKQKEIDNLYQNKWSRNPVKGIRWHVRPSKTRISLRISAD